MLKKIKDWVGTNLDVYKTESASDVGAGLVRHIWKGEKTATQIGTTLTAQIMNDMQKGLVHCLSTNRKVGTNKDIYEINLVGIDEFGIFDGLKLILKIDNENQYEDVFIKLDNQEYPLYILKNGINSSLEKGFLRIGGEYLITFFNNSFILSNSTIFGTTQGTALEGKRLGEIIGLDFGGKIQDTGDKETGKFYYDTATKHYFECIANNNLIYVDATKFRAISNKPILDKLDNLHKVNRDYIEFPSGLILQWGRVTHENNAQIGGYSSGSVTFPKTFRQTCLNLQITASNESSEEGTELNIALSSKSKNGFSYGTLRLYGGNGAKQKAIYYWQAIGY